MVVVLQFSLSFVLSSKPLLFARAWDFPFTGEATDMPTGKSRDFVGTVKIDSFLPAQTSAHSERKGAAALKYFPKPGQSGSAYVLLIQLF